jgi:hypothetical protein
MPISKLSVKNEDCNNTTRGGEAEDIRHEGKIYQTCLAFDRCPH